MTDDVSGMNYVGMPAALLLDHWGLMLREVFGTEAYLVGSAARGRNWRDVDVRVILDDIDYFAWFPGERTEGANARCSAVLTAFSLWGKHVTGPPIDFQVQRRGRVTDEQWDAPRIPLGIYVHRTPAP